MINLGDKIKDTISGFEGIATARHEYLNGCVRITIEPDKLDKDGKFMDAKCFDIEQLEVVTASQPRLVAATGGPHYEPSRPIIPSR